MLSGNGYLRNSTFASIVGAQRKSNETVNDSSQTWPSNSSSPKLPFSQAGRRGRGNEGPAAREETVMEYSIVIHNAEEGGYWAEVPALEGCYAQGETIEETLEDMKGAIETHIEFLIEDGREIPKDLGLRVERVTVSVPSAA